MSTPALPQADRPERAPAVSDFVVSTDPVARRDSILRLTLTAVAAVFASITLHEYSHAVAQLAFGGSAVVAAISSETVDALPPAQEAITAIVGPLASLVLGLVAWFGSRGLRQGFARSFASWFGLASMMNFFGYAIICFADAGDTAVAYGIWGAPAWAYIVSGFVGIAGMFALAWLFSGEVAAHHDGVRGWRTACAWPWLWATLVLVVVYLLAALKVGYAASLLPLVVAGPVTSLVAAPMAMMFAARRPSGGEPARTGSWAVVGAVFGLLLAVVAYHALAPVRLG